MKNIEIVNNLNNLNKFIQKEIDNNKSFVNSGARFKIKKNLKSLQSLYEVYNETLKDLINKYDLTINEDGSIAIPKDNSEVQEKVISELNSLLQIDNEITLDKIKDEDFTDECLVGDMLLLDFMTMEV